MKNQKLYILFVLFWSNWPTRREVLLLKTKNIHKLSLYIISTFSYIHSLIPQLSTIRFLI